MLTRITFALILILGLSLSIAAQERNDLVGSYLFRFAWGGTEIKLQPNGKFILHSSNCTQVFTESGPYSVSKNVLTLTTLKYSLRSFSDNKEIDLTKRKARKEYLDTTEPFKPEHREFQIVRWGQRIYLMYQESFDQFVEAVNVGFEPRQVDGYREYYGQFFLRVGDENKPADGAPSLPKEFVDQLLSAPVIATIVNVETIDNKTIATIDRGSVDGLRKDMGLVTFEQDSGSYFGDYRPYLIVSVEPNTAKVQTGETVTLGTKLTTRLANVYRY